MAGRQRLAGDLDDGRHHDTGAAPFSNVGPTWHVAAAADFNGDGKSDILWQNDSGMPAIWTMDGTTITAGTYLPDVGPGWHVDAAADFNGDGKSDIFWQNGNGRTAIWTMDGTTITAGTILPDVWAPWHVAAAADFNGDGKSDIFWQNDNGMPAIWTMDGTTITAGTCPARRWAYMACRSGGRFQRRRQVRYSLAARQRPAGDLDHGRHQHHRWDVPAQSWQRLAFILGRHRIGEIWPRAPCIDMRWAQY